MNYDRRQNGALRSNLSEDLLVRRRPSSLPQSGDDHDASAATPAVAYVRMSTDHQKYSTENQLDVIRRYATARGLRILRVYEDSGRSGLRIDGREAIQNLIAEVRSGRADFTAILVYDVSRWGRFQDADEGAYHEHVCSRAGIRVHYCGEQFENDGSIGSNLLKTVKRVMAGEYSRELSVKVFAGQCRLVELGFRQGGAPGYGLRRVLIDERRNVKGQLGRGDRKSLQTDRVVLAPGPPHEVELVRRMYRMFVEDGRFEREIAATLNAEGIATDCGRSWTRASVHQILTNEKYIGNNVYNKVSFKLKQRRVLNPREMWVRAERAYPSIIDSALFERARAIVDARARHYSDEELLSLLQTLLDQQGMLSGMVIDEREDMPSSSIYRHRFGSLLRAYELIGYDAGRDYRYIEINRALRRAHPQIVADIVAGVQRAGGAAVQDPVSELLSINGEFTASVVIARSFKTSSGALRWRVRLDVGLVPDMTIAIRLDERNVAPLDYYVLPSIDMNTPRLKLAEQNGLSLDAYRFESLDFFFALAGRVRFAEAA
ncbi:DNA invertase Pin-like site-specific DNA recombinase [Rhodoblastus acidophilus]|uniref:recombinase family protein n=1 Tax=Rhodoblastus acidophilus TaxID=1074 RepID=UPI002224BAE6|nr:recombinase family protein [Rhodoblastus acidophilus]MCW2314490.1 DNA invertase Pin-like site-specific DNA recombinase [Rhodoblastus acidophilus]